MMSYTRAWSGDDWEAYARQLVQLRHGAINVQSVPDAVKGDAGLEFFTTDGCFYQCYAPEEVADVAKAAAGMKRKASRDLKKIINNQHIIGPIINGIIIGRWILLCPFLDDKDVIKSIRANGMAVKNANIPFISDDFNALCHCQSDFATEIHQLRSLSLGPPFSVTYPSEDEVSGVGKTEVGQRIDSKLAAAYGLDTTHSKVASGRDAFVKAHLYRENALAELRHNYPALWSETKMIFDAEEMRLAAIGMDSTLPTSLLKESNERISNALQATLPGFSLSNIINMALGTVSDWLIRCPIDFPKCPSGNKVSPLNQL